MRAQSGKVGWILLCIQSGDDEIKIPVVVNVSSSLGSLSLAASSDSPTFLYPGVAYPASKSALNMITVQFAKQFPSMRINAVEPGYTDTDLNGHTGIQTVEEGARIIVEMAPDQIEELGRQNVMRAEEVPVTTAAIHE